MKQNKQTDIYEPDDEDDDLDDGEPIVVEPGPSQDNNSQSKLKLDSLGLDTLELDRLGSSPQEVEEAELQDKLENIKESGAEQLLIENLKDGWKIHLSSSTTNMAGLINASSWIKDNILFNKETTTGNYIK